MTHGRGSRRAEIVRTSLIAAAVAATASGAVVWADGGDPNVAHACVLEGRAQGEPNVVIVEPHEACPAGEPLHVALADAVVTPAALETTPPDTTLDPTEVKAVPKPKVAKKLYTALGIDVSKEKHVSKLVDEKTLSFGKTELAGFAACPASHPYRLLGSYSVPGGNSYITPLVNSPIGVSGWYTKLQVTKFSFFSPTGPALTLTFRLYIDLTCTKVKPPPKKVSP